MDTQERDEANAALALDEQVKERIEKAVFDMLQNVPIVNCLWANSAFRAYLEQTINQAIARAFERDLGHYLDRIQGPYR